MVPNFQSSFIPKQSVTEDVFKKKKAGFVGVLAVSLFISSIVIYGGIYFYKGMLKSDIQNLQAELAEAENNIDKKAIDEMAQFDKKLDIAKSIVAKHQVVSNFLVALASSTVSSVQFDSFNYGDVKGGSLEIIMDGKADSYASLALQDNILSKNEYIKSAKFSDLSLSERGAVSFKLNVFVDPAISVYSP